MPAGFVQEYHNLRLGLYSRRTTETIHQPQVDTIVSCAPFKQTGQSIELRTSLHPIYDFSHTKRVQVNCAGKDDQGYFLISYIAVGLNFSLFH